MTSCCIYSFLSSCRPRISKLSAGFTTQVVWDLLLFWPAPCKAACQIYVIFHAQIPVPPGCCFHSQASVTCYMFWYPSAVHTATANGLERCLLFCLEKVPGNVQQGCFPEMDLQVSNVCLHILPQKMHSALVQHLQKMLSVYCSSYWCVMKNINFF